MKISQEYSEGDIVKVPTDKVPSKLFTVTFYENLDEIAEYGLGAKKFKSQMGNSKYGNSLYNQSGTFFATSVEEAAEYFIYNYDPEDLVCLMIDTKYLDKDKLYYDTNEQSTISYLNGESASPTYYYADVIKNPQEVIEIVEV